MHNTSLDKLYNIVTTDEISNLNIETASYILNMLFTKVHPDDGNVFVFDSFQTCKDYVHHMFSHMNGFTTTGNDLKYTLSIDNDDERYLNSLDEVDASSLDNICLLTVIYKCRDNNIITLFPSIKIFDDEESFYTYIINFIKEKIIDKNVNLRKILKKLLQDVDIKSFIKKYDI